MPIMDGYEATKLIRKNDKDIPIIALTANVMQSDIQKTKEAGMNEHLHKPIDVSTLFKVLSKYINKEDNFSKDNKDTTMKIPNFKNIDKSIGLNYLSNNEELYLKILKSFYNDYKDFKIEKKDEDSLIKIHTLKGLSATIGAVELNHVVIQLHDTHDITLISEVESKLKIVIDELEVIL